MAQFFRTNKYTRATDPNFSTLAHSSLGMALGWSHKLKASRNFCPEFTWFENDLLDLDNHLSHPKVLITLARLWCENANAQGFLKDEELEACTALHLFNRFDQATPMTILQLYTKIAKMGAAYTIANARAEIAEAGKKLVASIEVRPGVGAAAATYAWKGPEIREYIKNNGFYFTLTGMNTPEETLLAYKSFYGVPITNAPAVIVTPALIATPPTTIGLHPGALFTKNLPANSRQEFSHGLVALGLELNQDNAALYFTKSVAIVMISVLKPGGATPTWIDTRVSRLANEMNLSPVDVTPNPEDMKQYEILSQKHLWDLSKYYQIIYDLGRWATVLNYPPVLWLIDQAKYSGMTISLEFLKLIHDLGDLPCDFLIDPLKSEMTAWINSLVGMYEAPYMSLHKVVNPATLFPTIAAFVIQVHKLLDTPSWRRYQGKFNPPNHFVVEKLAEAYIQMRSSQGLSATLNARLSKILKGMDLQLTIARDMAHVHLPQNIGTSVTPPPGIPQDFYDIITQKTTVGGSLGLGGLITYLKSHQDRVYDIFLSGVHLVYSDMVNWKLSFPVCETLQDPTQLPGVGNPLIRDMPALMRLFNRNKSQALDTISGIIINGFVQMGMGPAQGQQAQPGQAPAQGAPPQQPAP